MQQLQSIFLHPTTSLNLLQPSFFLPPFYTPSRFYLHSTLPGPIKSYGLPIIRFISHPRPLLVSFNPASPSSILSLFATSILILLPSYFSLTPSSLLQPQFLFLLSTSLSLSLSLPLQTFIPLSSSLLPSLPSHLFILSLPSRFLSFLFAIPLFFLTPLNFVS